MFAVETIITSESAEHPFIDMLLDGLTEFNAEATSNRDGRDLTVAVQSDGKPVGGCYAWTWAGICNVLFLHLPKENRGRGLGRRVMMAVEEEARRRGCHEIVLWTYSFQAPVFYQNLGFEIIHTFDDHPRGHKQHHLRKLLK